MPDREARISDDPLRPQTGERESGPFDSVWPNPTQELLLEAALSPGDKALAAWRDRKSVV